MEPHINTLYLCHRKALHYMEEIKEKNILLWNHSVNAANIALAIAKEMKLNKDKLDRIYTGALLHDYGKVNIPNRILYKTGNLDNDEWLEIKKHPIMGYELLKKDKNMTGILPIIKSHHERPDGKGYPDGLNKMNLETAIVSASDALEVMMSGRPYQRKKNNIDIWLEFNKNKGTQFDIKVAETVLIVLEKNFLEPIDMLVQM